MEIVKTIKVLNTLFEINNNRIEGYETASKEANERDLKTLFAHLVRTSHKCIKVLEREIYKLGGKTTDGTKVTGRFFRVWLDIKVGLTDKDRKTILDSCEFGENQIIGTYKKALEDDSEFLNLNQHTMIQRQYNLIQADHKKVKSLHRAMLVMA